MTLRIATWNVNSLRIRLPHVQRVWQSGAVDVLLLQETKTEDAAFPAAALQAEGLHIAFHGQKTYNGVAILSRFPLENIQKGFAGMDLENQARYISATVVSPMGPVRVASVYVPNGESLTSPKFAFKEAFYTALTTQVQAEVATTPAYVLGGDFNVAADERDVPNPARAAKDVLFTPQERTWLTTLQTATGLTDAFRHISQEPNVYSWWDYRTFGRNPNGGMRIDYLFTAPTLTPRIQTVTHAAAERHEPQPSDHVPVIVSLI